MLKNHPKVPLNDLLEYKLCLEPNVINGSCVSFPVISDITLPSRINSKLCPLSRKVV